jgi:hypothetical protein
VQKVAHVAGRAAPAVVVLGALAAAPQVHDVLAAAPAPAAGHKTAASPVYSNQAEDTVADAPATFKISKYLPRLAAAPTTSDSAPAGRPSPRPAPAHSGSTPGHSGSGQQGGTVAAGGTPPTCTGSGGMLPENFGTIVDFLVAHGYTGIAASGIAGNIWQESGGNPESVGSGGGGLIGWTPLPSGFVTGNPSADLQTQLAALLTYNEGWAQYIPTLNAATNATDAAYIYMTYFERPGIPAAGNREAAADAVAAACGL